MILGVGKHMFCYFGPLTISYGRSLEILVWHFFSYFVIQLHVSTLNLVAKLGFSRYLQVFMGVVGDEGRVRRK